MIAVNLGKVPYDVGLNSQNIAHESRVKGLTDDVVFLLEHEPVITIGKNGETSDFLVPMEELQQNVIIRRVNRGGKITCHYPGQLVVYPIVNLKNFNNDVHQFVFNLEEIIIRTLADFEVKGERIANQRGVFVANNKIASIGIAVKNSVTMHGFSFNIFADRTLYSLFIPCGITDKGITFLQDCIDPAIKLTMDYVKERILFHFECVFSISVSTLGEDCLFSIRHAKDFKPEHAVGD